MVSTTRPTVVVPTQPATNSQFGRVGNTICNSISGMLTGALAGHLFSIISPVGGAIFGATGPIASAITTAILDTAFPKNDSAIVNIIKVALPIIIGIGSSALAVSLCGFPITFGASLLLSGAILLTNLLVIAVIAAIGTCCLGAVAIAGASGALPQRSM